MKKLVTRLSIVFLVNTITCLFSIPKAEAQCTADTTIVYDTICLGDSLFINGFYRKVPGMYYDTFTNSSACDSLIFTHLISKGFAPETYGSEFYDGDFESWYNESTTCDTNNSMNIKFPLHSINFPDVFNIFSGISCNYNPLIQPSTDSYTGNTAMKIRYESSSSYQNQEGWLIMIGWSTAKPKELRGAFKFNGSSNDSLFFYVGVVDKDSVFDINGPFEAEGFKVFTGTTASYTPFSVELDYAHTNRPVDTFMVMVGVIGSTVSVEGLVDNLHMVAFDATSSTSICQGDSTLFNGKYYSTAGTYRDSFPLANGCDSIVEFVLNIEPTIAGNDTTTICYGDSLLINGLYRKTSGLYADSSTSVNGCDSVTFIYLDVLPPSISSLTTSACDMYISPSGKILTSSGQHIDVMTNANGCDSIINIILTINNSSQEVIFDSICSGETYASPSGKIISGPVSGFKDTIQSSKGCDSIFTISIYQVIIDTTVNGDGWGALKANQDNATYQWLYCDSGMTPVQNETSQIFSPNDGIWRYYAVAISLNGCNDTSICIEKKFDGIEENDLGLLSVFPNPTSGSINIEFKESLRDIDINIRDLNGKTVYYRHFERSKLINLNLEIKEGAYLLGIKAAGRRDQSVKLLIQ